VVLTQDCWALYWNDKDNPQHSSSDDAHYDAMARELLALLGPMPVVAVLELGCGNGAFYKRLGFDHARYLGVDFSPAMLSKFREAHTEAHLEAADVRGYVPADPVDLIYSACLLQYLSLAEIDRHLGSVRNALKPGGQILHAHVPWDLMRWPYYSGMLKRKQQGVIRSFASYLAGRLGLRLTLGHWHSVAKIREVAARHRLDTAFYGSLFYPYRFHVRMVPRGR
jgi:trans-aconitate methyltransferase